MGYRGRTDKIVLYMHAGSGNHGCEAIANTVLAQLDRPGVLMTYRAAEDEAYSLKDRCEIIEEEKVQEHFIRHVVYYLAEHVRADSLAAFRYRFRRVSGKHLYRMNLSIGGDNYCYESMLRELELGNRLFTEQGAETVLLCCSIEPGLLADPKILADLKRYRMIIARESITLKALCAAGLGENSVLIPDPAFTLRAEGGGRLKYAGGSLRVEAPGQPVTDSAAAGSKTVFLNENTVGLNVSPMAVENEAFPGILMENCRVLIRHILETTQMNIVLVPHVVWENNDDRKALGRLYEEFGSSGRVALVQDAGCGVLKGVIAGCRFFIGARTHATIAAYSSCVPTLALGYSVKARGIAQDLFGTWEHYVLPVQELVEEGELAAAYDWMVSHEEDIRDRLTRIMPGYQERAMETGSLIHCLMEE